MACHSRRINPIHVIQQCSKLTAVILLVQPETDQQQLPDGFSQQIFGSVYDQPLCSLYASSDTEGFSGRCETLPTHCSRNGSWCDGGGNPDSEAVEELMALQLTKVSHVGKRAVG